MKDNSRAVRSSAKDKEDLSGSAQAEIAPSKAWGHVREITVSDMHFMGVADLRQLEGPTIVTAKWRCGKNAQAERLAIIIPFSEQSLKLLQEQQQKQPGRGIKDGQEG